MPQPSVYPIPTCAECGLASAGRCPTCHRHLCMDHFGLEDHQPCARRSAAHAPVSVCYVCGSAVRPQQWSATQYAHYIDSYTCYGCRRLICDERHTALRYETLQLHVDSVRSHRYHVTRRYCGVCSPLRRIGGLIGAGWLGAALALASVVGALVILR